MDSGVGTERNRRRVNGSSTWGFVDWRQRRMMIDGGWDFVVRGNRALAPWTQGRWHVIVYDRSGNEREL